MSEIREYMKTYNEANPLCAFRARNPTNLQSISNSSMRKKSSSTCLTSSNKNNNNHYGELQNHPVSGMTRNSSGNETRTTTYSRSKNSSSNDMKDIPLMQKPATTRKQQYEETHNTSDSERDEYDSDK